MVGILLSILQSIAIYVVYCSITQYITVYCGITQYICNSVYWYNMQYNSVYCNITCSITQYISV